jgi:hypothetical protein
VLFVVYLKAHIDWVKFVGWVETPVGMAILFPLMPAYHAIKATFDGVSVTPILLISFLAVFTAVMVWEALKFTALFAKPPSFGQSDNKGSQKWVYGTPQLRSFPLSR